MIWKRGIPGDQFRGGKKMNRAGRQRRHMQRLTDMAGVIGAAGVLVQERTANGEIQNRRASHQG